MLTVQTRLGISATRQILARPIPVASVGRIHPASLPRPIHKIDLNSVTSNGHKRAKSVPTQALSKPVVMASAPETKTVLVPIANGSEEMEAVIVIDVLRRAGADVVVASVEDGLQVNCSRNVKLVADMSIGDAANTKYDLIVLPGGMPGAERLSADARLRSMVQAQREEGRLHAAICAAPAVFLQGKGIIGQDTKATAHPGFTDKLANQSAVNERVVVDGKLTTSRGPGTAFEFALSLVGQLYGREKMEAVAGPMVMYPFNV